MITKSLTPKVADHFTEEEIKTLVEEAKKNAMAGDKALQKFLLEQIFGKSPITTDTRDKDRKQKFGRVILPAKK